MNTGIEGGSFTTVHEAATAYIDALKGSSKEPATALMALGAIQALTERNEISISNADYARLGDSRRLFVQSRESVFQFIEENPSAWLTNINTVHMAGGILPRVFGDKDDPLWKEIVKHSKDGEFSFAGITLSLKDMALVGDCARYLLDFLKRKGICVDERVVLGGEHSQVHCHCGACEAIGVAIGSATVESDLHKRFEPHLEKQPILDGMPHHDSITIYSDLGFDTRIIKPEFRPLLQRHHALPFQASIPIEAIIEFSKERKLSPTQIESLIAAWCQLNVQIPRNIIGSHNNLSDLQDETVHVVNTSGISKEASLSDEKELVIQQIRNVAHKDFILLDRQRRAA